MKYLEKYDCFIDDDCVVYRMAPVRGNHGNAPGKLYKVKTHVDKCGYIRLSLWKVPNPYLHRVVAEAFVPNPMGLPTVDRIDRNKFNCNPANLRWASRKEQADNTANVTRGLKKYGVRQCEDRLSYFREYNRNRNK